MEQRDSIDRVSSEAPVSATAPAHPNGPGFNEAGIPASGQGPDIGNDPTPIVESVLQSDVRFKVTWTVIDADTLADRN